MDRPKDIAICPRCGYPVVFTFAFSRAEYYCLDCGRKFGMFGAQMVPPTGELIELTETAEVDWQTLSDGIISDGAHLVGCEGCVREIHRYHATAEELEADSKARARLDDRVKVGR